MARGLLLGSLGLVGSIMLLNQQPQVRKLITSVGRTIQKRVFSRHAAVTVGAPQTGLTVDPSKYPKVRRDESVVESLHGTKIADPYRWLEDPDSQETKDFVEQQNKLTQEVLSQCETREQFKELFTKLYNYPKFGTPFKKGERYYYYHNSGLQQQYVLYSQPKLGAEVSVVIDPNTWSSDGTVSLSDISFSEDGRLLAYSSSSGGSDWNEIKVLSVDEEGKPSPMDDLLKYVKFSSLVWTHDHKGFFYNRFPTPEVNDLGTETDVNTNQMLCYHTMGTPQSEDVLLYTIPEHPTRMIGADVTDDGRYLVLYISEGCKPANMTYLVDLDSLDKTENETVNFSVYDVNSGAKKLPVVKLVDNLDASYGVVANEGSVFYFKTNLDAPRNRIVRTDISKPEPPSSWTTIVPEHPHDVLKSASALKGDHLVLRYLRDVRGVLQLHSLSTGEFVREFTLPGVGSIGGFSGSRKYTEAFFSFSSFVEPGAMYRIDLADPKAEPELFRRTELSVPHDPADYETKQVFVPSKDGTLIPMSITHKKGIVLDGSNPTLLYGYGGFTISLEPGFSASRLCFMKGYNGVFAQANLRGGGEYGVAWRDAGSCHNKQNVFDDFQACSEYLISSSYCSASKLTIQGGSNGGLLVAACANQRPDLFACVLGQVGVMDMLRFHKFTIGHAWCSDYGSPDDPKDFKVIYKYSPLHNVRVPGQGSRQYPAVMLATGDHDDRVVPLHTHKLIATLQHELAASDPGSSAQRNPLLARIEVRAGHGAGKPTAKVIEEVADLMGFAAKCMGASWKA